MIIGQRAVHIAMVLMISRQIYVSNFPKLPVIGVFSRVHQSALPAHARNFFLIRNDECQGKILCIYVCVFKLYLINLFNIEYEPR